MKMLAGRRLATTVPQRLPVYNELLIKATNCITFNKGKTSRVSVRRIWKRLGIPVRKKKRDSKCAYDVSLRRVCTTIVAVEKQ
jgi:aminoglycoside/choline kinase family phosphotransferase